MSDRSKHRPVSARRSPSLKGRKIKLSCTLKSKEDVLLGKPGSILTIGRNVSVTIAKQLLTGHSAALIDKKPRQSLSDIRKWPDPVHFDPKGKAGQTITVHISVFLDGKSPSCLKLHAPSATFRALFDHWCFCVRGHHLGMLAIRAFRAGGGNFHTSQGVFRPPGIDIQRLDTGRPSCKRSIPVTLHINHEGKEHRLKFLAYRDVFQRLASFHHGDDASDFRFGDLLRTAMWTAYCHINQSKAPTGKGGKLFPRIAWETAAWLGPALLEPMMTAEKNHPDIYATIKECMTEEVRQLKCTPRNMAAFLVDKNWRNWAVWRRKLKLAAIEEWPTATTPIRSPGRTNEHSSIDFWDEIFNRQRQLKRFPWVQLRRTNPAKFTRLTEPAIEERKARYVQDNPGFDWEQCKKTNPHLHDKLIAKFLEEHMALYPFSGNVTFPKDVVSKMKWSAADRRQWKNDPDTGKVFWAVPTQGPQFILPKSFEETVQDILLNRHVFILSL